MSESGGSPGGAHDALEHLAGLAHEAGALELEAEARDLARRASEGRFYVACIGQFKRGKSTLVNALLDADLLPVGVTPVTSIPTVVRYGEPGLRIRVGHAWQSASLDQLADFVTEAGNPGNRLGVAGVEVSLQSERLRSGLCLVDTPGLGSISRAGTEATREFLPHIDAAIAVLGADPPISAGELAFIVDVQSRVDTVLFVLSKADRLPATDRAEARAFTERVLGGALGRPVGRILETSGVGATRDEAMARDWALLEAALDDLAERGGGALVEEAVRRGVGRIGGRLRWTLQAARQALLAPVEATGRRLEELRTLGGEVERVMADLAPLLEAESRRLSREFVAARERFLAADGPAALGELRARLPVRPTGSAELSRREALAVANAVARARLAPWLGQMEDEGAAAYGRATERFVSLARGLFERLDALGLGTPGLSAELAHAEALGRPRFFFHDRLRQHDTVAPWRRITDLLLPARWRRRRRRRSAESYLTDLLEVNASRVEGDLTDRITQSRQRFEAELRRLLAALAASGERAVARADRVRSEGESAVRAEVARLDHILERLDRVDRPQPR